jgi:putative membrane protein insertion efficiency factor
MTRARHLLWAAGGPARAALIAAIRLYRLTLSSALGGQCRFYPSCSHYAEHAIRTHGALRGSAMATWRIARCGPFTAGGVDHVPPRRARRGSYDDVILERAAS